MKVYFRFNAMLLCQMLWLSSAFSAESEGISITVDGPRPIAESMDKLSAKFGYVITYEDPRYEYPDDLVDATSRVRPNGPPEPRIMWPKGGKLELRGLQPPAAKDSAAVSAMLDGVLARRSEITNGGKFKVLRAGNTFHVVPMSVRNKAGNWVEQSSILEARITIPPAKRTVREMVEEICKEVALINNVKVVHMDPVFGSYLTQTVDLGAYNETARSVLIRTLAATGDKMTWRLEYIPSQGWTGYFLTLSQLAKPEVIRKPGAASQAPDRSSTKGSQTPMGPRR